MINTHTHTHIYIQQSILVNQNTFTITIKDNEKKIDDTSPRRGNIVHFVEGFCLSLLDTSA